MSILVTGGAGYIGSHAVKGLLDKGYEVVIVDNLETGFESALDSRAKFYKGDIRDNAFLNDMFSKEDVKGVIHFAANSLVGESMTNPLKYFDNNVHGTRVLLSAMLKYDVKHIVFSSTAATYGEPVRIPIDESHPTSPINPYGEAKLMMEKVIDWTSKAHDLTYVSLRYFNVAGAHPSGEIGESHDPETHLIPIILQVPNGQREKLSVFGNDYDTKDGTCIRDYIHIEDLVEAHVLALEYLLAGKKSDIFNLGSGDGYSIYEMIEAAKEATGQEIAYEIADRRPGDPAVLIASNNKAKDVLNWSPKHTDVKDIIKSAWHFHKKYPNGFKG
ncbi:UDP-glucose 4-epimerase GalE [Acidaminobacter sp. JC074]|uniref:UDP-glucose 4-epimerase GalE n=1 Tax=Acidaminobacter sp. JC074 TaxID=2530199 RepID=UPI001F0D3640|nr:UDP-glucose 4-epimerase GalE [Acidaminobacter sp. JC074]MCH4886817.1 UDP-glucose 4-epimerase GalE [Acidaminobacter sp. JC074]